MISGTFSLVQQLIGMNAFPALRIQHTSRLTAGQIYIGALNWLLMIGTIAVVGGFGSSSALTLAYGVGRVCGLADSTISELLADGVSLPLPRCSLSRRR
jgi:KUP system potassium uptake protein